MRAQGAIALIMMSMVAPAGAVVMGSVSFLDRYMVRLAGNGYCSGVAIARQLVATAAHCAHGMYVIAGGHTFGVSGYSRRAVLDDGRHVGVSGDAAILRLSRPLPPEIEAAPVGEGAGNIYTIAGYGDTHERRRSGRLHEAVVIPADPQALVDPNRHGSLSASACFGDSGGPVFRGDVLVGVITRAAHPSPRLACGDLTRWAPIRTIAPGEVVAAKDEEPRSHHHRRAQTQAQQGRLFNWFGQPVEAKVVRRSTRHKEARE
jgi:trypsin